MIIQSNNQQANTIIQEITQRKNLVQSALYFAGEKIQTASQNSALPDAVKSALEIAANSAMQTGAEEWAGGLYDKYWKEVKQNPGQGGSGQNAANNHAARKLREYLNGNPKIPQLVKDKIEAIVKQAPTKAKGGVHNPKQGSGVRGGGRPSGAKGKGRGSKNREFEFLFEAPLLPLTPYVSTYISPELQGSSYYTGISSEQQSQWLFESPYILAEVDWFVGTSSRSNTDYMSSPSKPKQIRAKPRKNNKNWGDDDPNPPRSVEPVGQSTGDAPRNNTDQNKQIRRLVRKYKLTKDQQQQLHIYIKHQGFDFRTIESIVASGAYLT